MNIKEWLGVIAGWERAGHITRQQIGGPRRYDPTQVKAGCEKCDKHAPHMSRHHKANDFFFALWWPDLYAQRYIEFRPEDTSKLCNRCHTNCERYYAKLKQELYVEFNAYRISRREVPYEWCEEWRAKFLHMFYKWMSRPIRRKKKSRTQKVKG